MSPLDPHERYSHQILSEIEAGHGHSQRSLATSVGIALGLTNLLVRRLVRKGWVRMIRIKPKGIRYLLTPAGLAAKARMSHLYLQDSLRFYVGARDRVRERLATLGDQWPAADDDSGACGRRIVFCGLGEVAEIAYVCLQETDLRLVAAIGDGERRQFFGLPVHQIEDISADAVDGTPFDCLVVTSFENRDAIRSRLEARGIAPERVHWL